MMAHRFLSRFSLRAKFLAGLAVPLAALLIGLLLVRIQMTAILGDLDAVVSERHQIEQMLGRLNKDAGDMLASLAIYVAVRDTGYADAYRHQFAELNRVADRLQGHPLVRQDAPSLQALDAIRRHLAQLATLDKQLLSISAGDASSLSVPAHAHGSVNPISQQAQLLSTGVAPLHRQLDERLKMLTARQDALTEEAGHRLVLDSLEITGFVSALLYVALTLSIGAAWWISRIVTQPIRQVAGAMQEMAHGDAALTRHLDDEGKDEVALLGRSFNTIIDKARRSYEEERALSNLLRISLEPTDMKVYLDQALATMIDTVTWLSLLPKGGIFVTDPAGGLALKLVSTHNFSSELLDLCATVPFGRCLCGRAAADGEIIFAHCIDERHEITFEAIKPHGHYNVPIKLGSEVLGVLVLYLPHGHQRSPDEAGFLDRVGEVLCMGIRLRQANASVVSAKQRAEAANAQLSGITANLPGAIFQCARSAHEEWVFPFVGPGTARLLGTSNDDPHDDMRRLLQDVYPQDQTHVRAALKRAAEQRAPINVEYRVLQQSGGTRWILCSAVPRQRSDMGILWDGLLLDITERKNLEGQLLQAQKLESIGQLAAGIAHEINTPTQYVQDNTRFLQEAFKDYQTIVAALRELRAQLPADGREPAAAVDRLIAEKDLSFLDEEVPQAISQSLDGLQRIASIVSAMKEFAHPGADTKEPVDVNTIVRNVVTVSRNEWKYVADLELDLSEALPAVSGYGTQLGQTILNLIVNAAHAISDGTAAGRLDKGLIRIATSHANDNVEIRISDNGPGVPEDIQEKIFDPFFTTKDVGKGTGQGLSIARSVVVDQHQGSLTLESAPGNGATFLIRLPLEPKPVGAAVPA